MFFCVRAVSAYKAEMYFQVAGDIQYALTGKRPKAKNKKKAQPEKSTDPFEVTKRMNARLPPHAQMVFEDVHSPDATAASEAAAGGETPS